MAGMTPDPDPALLWTATPPTRTVPKPGERLFMLHREGHRLECELRYHGEFGVETQFLKDGELLIGRRFDTKKLAVQWAELEGEAWTREGWIRR